MRSTPGNSCSLKKWISIFWTWCCICQPLTGGDRYAPFTNEMSEEILNQPPLQQQTAINASSSSSDSRFHSCIPSSCSRPMNLLKYDRVNPSDTIDTTGTGYKTTTCTNPVNKACSSPRRAQHQPIAVPHRNCLALTRTHENQGTNNPLGGYVLQEKSIHQTQTYYAMNVNNGINMDRWGGVNLTPSVRCRKKARLI